ncbi:MAG: Gfo/Idh/MocA family oxidoreductase [Puniceicoccales bacterium]|jgi:predicted dehydrogenase|nr:Gfo/Idh/MocA family oxidoreductase [Puniceicoccales bacterium]
MPFHSPLLTPLLTPSLMPLHTPINRRRFLRNLGAALVSGAAVPTVIPASALGRGGAVAPSGRIAIGVVGAAHGLANARRFLTLPDVAVTAVCDVDAHRLASAVADVNERQGGVVAKPWRDFREMFDKAGLDAVVLAAPDHWHGVMAIAAARAGLDIWAETPLARTLAEGRAAVNAAANRGCVWQTGTWRRSVREYRLAAGFVQRGGLGLVTHVEVGSGSLGETSAVRPEDYGKPPAHLDYEMWVGPGLWTEYDARVVGGGWRGVSLYGGGTLADTAPHFIDIAQWALGMNHSGPVTIAGSIGREDASAEPFDVAPRYRCVCAYASGATLAVSAAFPRGVRFYGERGWLFVGDKIGMLPDGSIERPVLEASDSDILAEVPPSAEVSSPFYRSDNHWRNFADCVKSRRRTASPAETGHRSACIAHLGRIAALTGRRIRWSPDAEEIKDDETASQFLRPNFRMPWML